MYTTTIPSMSLEQISRSGQCFRIRQTGENRYGVTARNHYTEITQEGELFCFSCSEEEFLGFWHFYFDLDTDYNAIKSLADPSDAHLCAAMLHGDGIRILNQDLWEMIVTFLISQNNNINRITRSVEALCLRLGSPMKTDSGESFHPFPSPGDIVSAGSEALAGLGLGYRDKYIWETASRVSDGRFCLDTLRKLPYEEANALLMEQYGIGKKVADCVCLFGLHHIDAFPLDTHMKNILRDHYPNGFPFERYRGCLGVIQQYLFYYDL